MILSDEFSFLRPSELLLFSEEVSMLIFTKLWPTSPVCCATLSINYPGGVLFSAGYNFTSLVSVFLVRSPTLLISKPRNLSLLTGEKGAASTSPATSASQTAASATFPSVSSTTISGWHACCAWSEMICLPSTASFPSYCNYFDWVPTCVIAEVVQIEAYWSTFVSLLLFKDGCSFGTLIVLKGGISVLLATLRESSDS